MKTNDYVLVAGEADEVFQVIGVKGDSVILSTGVVEPKKKCTRIPKRFHNKLHTVSSTHIDYDSFNQIMKEDKEDK